MGQCGSRGFWVLGSFFAWPTGTLERFFCQLQWLIFWGGCLGFWAGLGGGFREMRWMESEPLCSWGWLQPKAGPRSRRPRGWKNDLVFGGWEVVAWVTSLIATRGAKGCVTHAQRVMRWTVGVFGGHGRRDKLETTKTKPFIQTISLGLRSIGKTTPWARQVISPIQFAGSMRWALGTRSVLSA